MMTESLVWYGLAVVVVLHGALVAAKSAIAAYNKFLAEQMDGRCDTTLTL